MLDISILLKFVRENGIQALNEKFAIDIKIHNKYNNLYQLKYNQIESPMHNPLVQMCRGIILNSNDNWNPVCYGLNKFFNHDEGHIAKDAINWKKFYCYEKLDGTCCQLFYYDNKWQVSTLGSPDAGGNVGDFNFTFAELFWKVWHELNYELPDNTELTYVFELMTPYNRIVVDHKDSRLVFLAARNMKYYFEVLPETVIWGYGNNWECVKRFPLNNYNDIVEFVNKVNPLEQEGFVICDDSFNRLKIKSPQYIAFHHIVGSMSIRNMLEIVRTNESSEFLSAFPEWANLYNEIKEKYDNLVNEIETCYNKYKNIECRKDFALAIKDKKYSGVLFLLKSYKVTSVRKSLADMNIKNLEELLDLKN